jgi:1-phosphofructokinase family hexose kinase
MVQKIKNLAKPGDWWILSGSLPPGTSSNMYAEIIRVLRDVGANAILDAEGEPLRLGCAERPFLVKPNHAEAQMLTGFPTNTIAETIKTAQAILTLGPKHVIISMGEMGAVLVSGDGAWQISSPKIQARNPIGAGDSLVGGLVWGLSQGLPMLEALCWGVTCGAATASLSGTTVGLKEMVETLVKEVNVLHLVPHHGLSKLGRD